MKTVFDIEVILFNLLNQSPVKDSINGSIYLGDDRPNDSDKEDIVVSGTELTQDSLPQTGISDLNLFVPDKDVTIGGQLQWQANRTRLKELLIIAMETLRGANLTGIKLTTVNQTVLAKPDFQQHFVSIRIEWNIFHIN